MRGLVVQDSKTLVLAADAKGFDMSVTDVQMRFNGSFKESDGINHPYFSMKLYMGVK